MKLLLAVAVHLQNCVPKSSFAPSWYDDFTLIRIVIRGVTNEELVYVLKREFKNLNKDEQRRLRS